MIDELLRDYLDKKIEQDIDALNKEEKAALEKLEAINEERSKIGKVNEILDKGREMPPSGKKEHSYFFVPRVGKLWEDGIEYKEWKGRKFRTLVLGIHQICNLNCEWKHCCCDSNLVWKMDEKCKCYVDKREGANKDYLKLSNGNTIEIDAYIESDKDNKDYAFYSAFTKYMVNRDEYKYDHLSEEVKSDFWEHVIYHNFFQYYLPNSEEIDYNKNKDKYKEAIPALKEVLETYKPEIVIVWTRNLYLALKDNPIDGLKPYDPKSMSVGSYYARFSYYTCLDSVPSKKVIEGYLKEKVSRYSDIVDAIKEKQEQLINKKGKNSKYLAASLKIRDRYFNEDIQKMVPVSDQKKEELQIFIDEYNKYRKLLLPHEAIVKLIKEGLLDFIGNELVIPSTKGQGSLEAKDGGTIVKLFCKEKGLYDFTTKDVSSFLFKYHSKGKAKIHKIDSYDENESDFNKIKEMFYE